jgi:hypothetical protein
MPCNAIRTEKFGTVIMCGPGRSDEPCAFCGANAMLLCDWRELKEVSVPAKEIRKGDVLLCGFGFGEVVFAQRNEDVVMVGTWDRGGIAHYRFNAETTYMVRRMATCDAACCAVCAVERAPEVHCCPDHWRAWEQVA